MIDLAIFLLKQPFRNVIKRMISLSSQKVLRILNIENSLRKQIPSKYSYPPISNSFINYKTIDLSKLGQELEDYLIQHYLLHKFDLLGSGWIEYKYPVKPRGIENVSFEIPDFCFLTQNEIIEHTVPLNHLNEAKILWDQLSSDYVPIDWQRDYKSGFRWDGTRKSSEQTSPLPEGADLKMPWELSRMQFLPQLAVFAISSQKSRQKILSEFKNIVLDFIATNIPGYGVNWMCTMDVAIRATNILVAYDILSQLDTQNVFDTAFKSILQKSIFEHGWFIANNLEYSEIITSNHYFSNVCGLLFIASYLEENEHTNTWLAFSVQEILNETQKQFYNDGGNFEASTSYHRLSSEMLLFSYALMLQVVNKKAHLFNSFEKIPWRINPKVKWNKIKQLPKKITGKDFAEEVFKTGTFAASILKNNGEIPQIGDNDSGRFLKFTLSGQFITNGDAELKYHNLKGYCQHIQGENSDAYFDENVLNHRSLIAAYSGIFSNVGRTI